jgi:hypothetical protein
VKNHLKFPRVDCCNTSYTSCNDVHHRLILSTTNSSKSINNLDFNPTTIQGPCGNNTYECLSSSDESPSMFIPCMNDKQLIIGQLYSTINERSSGKVRMVIF